MKITSSHNKYLWTSLKSTALNDPIPIQNWDDITSGNLYALFKGEPNKKFSEYELQNVWFHLQDQHFEEFGIDQLLQERVKTLEKLLKLNTEFIETKDRMLLNFITIESAKLEEVITKHFSFYEVLSAVTNYKRFNIDPKTYPAISWFWDLKNMSNGKSS